jgi:hypothetical protein
MPISYPPYPIPVLVEEDIEGYVLYVDSGGQFENDIWTIVHKEGGIVRHYNTSQVLVIKNATFDIVKKQLHANITNP